MARRQKVRGRRRHSRPVEVVGRIYPAEALNADVIRVRPTRRAVDDAVLQLVVRRRPGNPAEELAAILHEYFMEKERKHGGKK